MAVSSNEKWSWADENRDILTQAEAGGNPAVGERFTNNICRVHDVIVVILLLFSSIMAVIVVKHSKRLSEVFYCIEKAVCVLEMRERMKHPSAAKKLSHELSLDV